MQKIFPLLALLLWNPVPDIEVDLETDMASEPEPDLNPCPRVDAPSDDGNDVRTRAPVLTVVGHNPDDDAAAPVADADVE
jgi:hypothetical protein